MKEKFERFKNEKIVINVRSQKQYNDFMKMCEEQGLKWGGVGLATSKNPYNMFKEETCLSYNFSFNDGLGYSDIKFYEGENWKVIKYKDFIKTKQFTKSDLKDNHIVILRNGMNILYKKNKEDIFYEIKNHDLTHSYGASLDIVEVWEFDKLVYKREEKPIEILDEVEKRWLKHFIKSTSIKVNYIRKHKSMRFNNREYLDIYYNDSDNSGDYVKFPHFEKGSMYKGLELNKKYTLEELGLEE